VPLVDGDVDDVPAEELGAAKNEDVHTLKRMVWFVRHAQVVLDLERPASTWQLSPEGHVSAEELASGLAPVARVLSSPEPKALATAAPIARGSGVEVEVDERLREVERAANLPDVESHREAVRAYLDGKEVDGWEDRSNARARFAAAIEGVDDAAVVTHATVLSLFLGYDFAAWAQIGLPDVIEWHP
jgi:broad specificity phosphatase PhoE